MERRRQIAERRLEAALTDQERLTVTYQAAAGTGSEQSAYARLRAATQAVRDCQRAYEAEARRSSVRGDRFAFSVLSGVAGPAEARAEVARCVDGRVCDTAREIAALLTSETVTNAVLHGACSPTAVVDVDGDVSPERLRIEIRNDGPAFDPQPDTPDTLEPHGRGLVVLDRLARRWGAARAHGRTCVWFELAL